MEPAALVLLAVGAADLPRRVRPRALAFALSAAVVTIVTIGAGIAASDLGTSVLAAVIAGGTALAWRWVTSDERAHRAIIGPPLLVVALACVTFLPISQRGSAFVGSARGSDELAAAITPLSTGVLLAAVGGALFLVESANVIVRIALRGEGVAVEGNGSAPPRRRRGLWRRGSRAQSSALIHASESEPTLARTLRGGRIIGPLERFAIAGLVLAQAYPVVAALVAAKGIVRFPEISRDRDRGTQAEYFLVGSMVSWSLALAVAGVVWLAAIGV